jgi:hypothetical protein
VHAFEKQMFSFDAELRNWQSRRNAGAKMLCECLLLQLRMTGFSRCLIPEALRNAALFMLPPVALEY